MSFFFDSQKDQGKRFFLKRFEKVSSMVKKKLWEKILFIPEFEIN